MKSQALVNAQLATTPATQENTSASNLSNEATPVASPAAKAPHTELNGLAIAWMLIKDFFKGLVGKKSG